MSPDFHLGPILPEFILAVGALALLMLGALRGERSAWLVTELAIALLGVSLLIDVFTPTHGVMMFYGAFLDDPFGRFMKGLALLGSMASLVMSIGFLRQEGIDRFEYPVLVILSTLGMMILLSANSLIALYLGFELMSLALYVLAAFHRDNIRATEAGLKYFVLGALSSGMLLYGASLIYGYAGTVSFGGIATALQGHSQIGVIFGLVFLSAGLAFKMSTVPFHMWTPDVYEGAPTPVTAFFATAPKMAAVGITVRPSFTASASASGIEAAEVLPCRSTVTTTRSIGRSSFFAVPSMMRIFAWCGTSQSISEGFSPFFSIASVTTSDIRRTAWMKTFLPSITTNPASRVVAGPPLV